jgi:hypothetical protein
MSSIGAVDLDRTLYEIAYGQSCPPGISCKALMPSKIFNMHAHALITNHQARWRGCHEILAEQGWKNILPLKSTEGNIEVTKEIIATLMVITKEAICLAEEIKADRYIPLRERWGEQSHEHQLYVSYLRDEE